MKKALTVFGLILHIAYYIFAVLSLGDYEYKGYGVGKAFTFWLFAMIISLHCMFLCFGLISFLTFSKYNF